MKKFLSCAILSSLLMTGCIIGSGCSKEPAAPTGEPFDPTANVRIEMEDGGIIELELYGNLAPKGALVKTSAVPDELKRFSGKARVFNNEDECYEAFHKNEIVSGDALIIRYEGPKGGPGMKEMHRVTEIVKKIPNTAVITDGRFSGASGGLSIGYLCPEAKDGGAIALVENGDEIKVDLYAGTMHLCVSDAELEKRRVRWTPHAQSGVSKFLARYSDSVEPSDKGAVLK